MSNCDPRCPSESAQGRPDRCGLFSVPRRCDEGVHCHGAWWPLVVHRPEMFVKIKNVWPAPVHQPHIVQVTHGWSLRTLLHDSHGRYLVGMLRSYEHLEDAVGALYVELQR